MASSPAAVLLCEAVLSRSAAVLLCEAVLSRSAAVLLLVSAEYGHIVTIVWKTVFHHTTTEWSKQVFLALREGMAMDRKGIDVQKKCFPRRLELIGI